MRLLRVRLMRAEDIDERADLYLDARVQSNLTHAGSTLTREQVRSAHLGWLQHDWHERLMYRVSTESDQLVGFTWLTDIDWLSRSCELSIMLVPAHRSRLGMLALITMYRYLYDTLNMHVVVNQVLSGNEMLLSEGRRESLTQVVCPDHVYTVGKLRTAYVWGQTRSDHEALMAHGAERAARISARVRERQG